MVQRGLYRAVELDEFEVSYRPRSTCPPARCSAPRPCSAGRPRTTTSSIRPSTSGSPRTRVWSRRSAAPASVGPRPRGPRRTLRPFRCRSASPVPSCSTAACSTTSGDRGSIRARAALQIPEAAFMDPAATDDRQSEQGRVPDLRERLRTASSSVRRLKRAARSGDPDRPVVRLGARTTSLRPGRPLHDRPRSAALGVQITADGVTSPVRW